MRTLFFIAFAFLATISSWAQKQLSDYSAQELEQKKKEAVDNGTLTDAAVYKKAEDLRNQLNAAISAEEYDKAAALKKQLKQLKLSSDDDRTAKLQTELKQALADEDYEKAAKIKKQLSEDNNKSAATSSSNNPVASSTSNSQGTMPTLEFINQVYFWNKTNNTIGSLEYDTPELKTKVAGGFGYSQATSYWTIPGTTSNVALNLNEGTSFILKTSPGFNPVDLFRLVKFEILGKKEPCRHMAYFTSSAAAYAGSSTTSRKDNDVMITYNKLQEGYYEIVVNGSLQPGEYTFYGLGKMYSFSINTTFSNTITQRPSSPNQNQNVFATPATTTYSKNDIYTQLTVAWFGLDFSLFTLTFSKKTGAENEMVKHINGWQRAYEKEIPQAVLAKWMRKSSVYPDKTSSENLYQTNLKQNWITDSYHDISRNEIQNLVQQYRTNGRGIGLVLLPQLFNEDKDNYMVEFVWFDLDTKAIIHSQKISGRGKGGATQKGWIEPLIDATKIYIDQYYKKEKAY